MDFKIKKAFSVIGVGYGDEGKGSVVDYLATKNPYSVVFRHSGGHQVGHTVMIGEDIHEFRHFGSATFRDIPTIWDKRCTVSPLQFEIEFKQLQTKFGLSPKLHCHSLCPVTTLFDIAYNRAKEKQYKTGSVGVGFGATLKRHELVPLCAIDLRYKSVLELKLSNINIYYFNKCNDENIFDLYFEELGELGKAGYNTDTFIKSCEYFVGNTFEISEIENDYFDTVIFEGNQGILLDKIHGFYPNVTYGYTTNKRVKCDQLNTFYVSRCYSTRHGHGLLKNENLEIPVLKNNEFESNHVNAWQDNFRSAILDYDLVEYAIKCDQAYEKNRTSSLVMTCMDQIDNPLITVNGEVKPMALSMFNNIVDNIYINTSPDSKTIKLWR